MDPADVWLTISAPSLAFMRSGINDWMVEMHDQTLRSNIFFASEIERSEIGMLYCAPALLTRTSSEPPVSSVTSETQADIDESDRTSNVNVSIPEVLRDAIFEGFRAVAKTRNPTFWYATARATPSPPSELTSQYWIYAKSWNLA